MTAPISGYLHVLPMDTCPDCRTRLDGAFSPVNMRQGAAPPKAGDVTLCPRCGGVLVFGEDLRLRAMDSELLAQLDAETTQELQLFQRAIVKVQIRRAGGLVQ